MLITNYYITLKFNGKVFILIMLLRFTVTFQG